MGWLRQGSECTHAALQSGLGMQSPAKDRRRELQRGACRNTSKLTGGGSVSCVTRKIRASRLAPALMIDSIAHHAADVGARTGGQSTTIET
jgi:hypothetical protein